MKHLLLVALALAPLHAYGDALEETLAKLDHAAAGFRSMSADLKQTAHTAVINEDNVESGTIRMQRLRPADTRMLVNFTAPDPKVIQLQGQKLDIYLPKAQTIQEYDLGNNRALIEQFLLLGFGTSRKELMESNSIRYIGTETVNGVNGHKLELVPKSKEVQQRVKNIELWLGPDGYPLQHRINQPGGDYQMLVFTNLKINPALKSSELELKAPKGVKKEYPQR